jgi:hypothetical protein
MSDLRGNNTPPEMSLGSTGKIVGALIVVLAVGAAGAYSYKTGVWTLPPRQKVADSQLPSPSPPALPTAPAQKASPPAKRQPISERNQPAQQNPRPQQNI